MVLELLIQKLFIIVEMGSIRSMQTISVCGVEQYILLLMLLTLAVVMHTLYLTGISYLMDKFYQTGQK